MLTITASAKPAEKATTGRIVFHPRYRAWLQKCGLNSAADVRALRGEVVCGHADRHVVKVELGSGISFRATYLKREHVVGRRAKFRNWLAGFGWISRAAREAATLGRLEKLGLPGPQWLAHGEDAQGRAFLLIEELADAVPLREFLADTGVSPDERNLLAERLGRALAECHAGQIGTPELAAKHILVLRGALQPTLIDWQSGTLDRPVTPAQAVQWFGTLHATLPPECLPTPVRLRMLWAYRRVLKSSGAKSLPRFGAFVRCISDSAKAAAKRSSVRQQLGAPSANPQRLVWLDGEAAVAIPGVAAHWHNGPTGEPFYDRPSGGESLARSDGTTGELTRFHTFAPLGLARAALRERPWRSPGATAARVLFHLERFGIPGPKLLAFGQRSARRCSVQSFVLTSPLGAAVNLESALTPGSPLRNRTLSDLGHFLKRLHDSGCRPLHRLLGSEPLAILAPGLTVSSPLGVRIVRRVGESAARADLAFALAGLERFDKMRVLRSYLGSRASDRIIWARYAAAVL